MSKRYVPLISPANVIVETITKIGNHKCGQDNYEEIGMEDRKIDDEENKDRGSKHPLDYQPIPSKANFQKVHIGWLITGIIISIVLLGTLSMQCDRAQIPRTIPDHTSLSERVVQVIFYVAMSLGVYISFRNAYPRAK